MSEIVSKLEKQFRRAKGAGVPILVVETVDQPKTTEQIIKMSEDRAVILWDIIRGIEGMNKAGIEIAKKICKGEEPALVTGSPTEMLSKAFTMPDKTFLILSNAHRIINDPTVSQGICNLREQYKNRNSMIILLCPSIVLPSELKQDVMIIEDTLPSLEQVTAVVKSVCEDNEIGIPDDIEKISDTLIGLSSFGSEQTLATCVYRKEDNTIDIDRPALWERKRKAIEQTPG